MIPIIAVTGDHFMRPDFFEAALRKTLGAAPEIRCLELDWPDTPMQEGYGLKEFVGDPDDLVAFLRGAQILVNHVAPVTGGMLDRLPDLKLIGVSRGGPVNIDMGAARDRGVTVVNAPGRNATAVVEFTVGAILSLTRLITLGHTSLSQGIWRGDLYRADTTGEELSALTIGLVGYGEIGSKLPAVLLPFGCELLVCDPYVTVPPQERVTQVDMATLLARSDVVSLHARVTPETTRFMGDAQFAAMKDGAYFINTARGPLVDYDALTRALTTGKLRGAFVETFGIEPPPASWPLLSLPNVTLTPHIAGASLTTVRRAAGMIAEDVRRYLAGEPLLYPVV